MDPGAPVDTSVIESQLALRDRGGARENAEAVIRRVARSLAAAEVAHGVAPSEIRDVEREFQRLMRENRFWPSGRILNNAGSRQRQLASCFVLPLPDDFDGVLDSLRVAARCHRSGGGTGFDFSQLREQGAYIAGSEAAGSSGPLPWLQHLDSQTLVVSSGGKMRGANMAALSIYHPDVEEFIRAKRRIGSLSTCNLSVLIDDAFMQALDRDGAVDLVSPHGRRVRRTLPARELWDQIVDQAWRTGDPGMIFVDAVNRANPLLCALGPITVSNPCGEQLMYPYESSNLGSINLCMFGSHRNGVAWDELADTVQSAVRLLDNAIDACVYPDERVARQARDNRRLGLGVMGYADLLVQMRLPYDSEEALGLASRIAQFIQEKAWEASRRLAKTRGVFPNYARSSLNRRVRNCAVTSIAPTGTISMVAGCSSGIEPRFAAAYRKDVIDEDGVAHVDAELVALAQACLAISADEAVRLLRSMPLDEIGLPADRIAPFRYSHDIDPIHHVRTAAVWQRYVDNGVSKTINLPKEAEPSASTLR